VKAPIRLAILGCGAITRSEHLPAAIAHPDIELVALVDAEISRAQGLIRNRGLDCRAVADFHAVLDQIDAIINALPNHLHVTSNQECLRAGVHVLCEKPLAVGAADARACTELAEERGLVLAVGTNRRFAASHALLKLILVQRRLGSLQHYDFQYGGAFDWRSASGFYFDRFQAGGGALLDFGVHMLDSVLDWFGPVTAFDYQDDDWGSGIESNVMLAVKHQNSQGEIEGHLRLSRTFQLKNRLLVGGSDASAEISMHDPEVLIIHQTIGDVPVRQTLQPGNDPVGSSYYRQLDNFVHCILNGRKPEVDGWQAARVMELIEQCYAHKRRIPEPWAELNVLRSGALA
jgi:predicted dehydrogenase